MRTTIFLTARIATLAAFLFIQVAAADTLVVGRSLPLSGPLKAIGEFKRDGGDAYINKTNAAGGIAGRKIELITLDDAYKPENTVANLRKIATENKPVAFLNLLRLPAEGNAIPLLTELQIPAIGVSSATDALRAQFNPYGFPVRGGMSDEARKLVNHVKVIGMTRISVVSQDVPLGKNLKLVSERALKDANFTFTNFEVNAPAKNIAEVADQVVQARPQAVILGLLTPAAVEMVAELRKKSFGGSIYTFSSTEPAVVAKLLGKQAVGMAISQIVPIPNGPRVKIVAEYLQAVKALGRGTPSALGLEAYIEAKVLIEGLRRSGPNPTTASLIKGLETLRDYDLGGYFVSYTPETHLGSVFVEVDVISAKGELIR